MVKILWNKCYALQKFINSKTCDDWIWSFVHAKAFSDAKANFIYANEVAKILPKILDEKGIINIGSSETESIYSFAKKSNSKVKPISITKVKNFPKDSSINVEKLNSILNRKEKLKKKMKKKVKILNFLWKILSRRNILLLFLDIRAL